jgi:uncharacterized protein DUF748
MTLYVLKPGKPWYKKVRTWIVIPVVLLIALFILFRLALNPVINMMTANGFSKLQGFTGNYESVSFSFFKFRYLINNLKLERTDGSGFPMPLATIPQVEASFSPKQLFHGKMVARMHIEKPVFAVPLKEDQKPPASKPPNDISVALRETMPFAIERIEILDGEMHIIDTGPGHEIKEKKSPPGEGGEKPKEFARAQVPEILVNQIEVTVENVHTRTNMGRDWPTVIAVRALIQRTGVLTGFFTADLLAEKLTFAGQMQIVGLDLTELNPVIEKESGLKVNKGTFELYMVFQARNGLITGGIMPLLKDAEVERVDSSLITKMKEILIDNTLSIISDRVPGRRAVASTIPIEGKIRDPNMQFLPALLGLLRNAFVEGLAEGLNQLPLPHAKNPQGAFEQAAEALTPGTNAPKVQPGPEQLAPLPNGDRQPAPLGEQTSSPATEGEKSSGASSPPNPPESEPR